MSVYPGTGFYCIFLLLFFVAGSSYAQQHKWKPNKQVLPPLPTHDKAKRKLKGQDTVVKVNLYYLDTLKAPIPLSRSTFHDKIDKEQIAIDKRDGSADTVVTFKRDPSWSMALSMAFLDEIDAMQVRIENMPANGRNEETDNQHKIRCLRAVYDMLQRYRQDTRPDPQFYVSLVANMDSLLISVNENRMNEFAHKNLDIFTLDNSKDLFETRPDLRALLYIKVGQQFPVKIVKRLAEFADKDYAGDIIADAARIDPKTIFYYASSTNLAIKNAVYHTDDSFVQCIVKIEAFSKAPLKALSFLPDIYYGRKTIEEIDEITKNPARTFQQLTRLKIENDSLGRPVYAADITERALNYVRKLDELHESGEDVRFQCVDSLASASLYYIVVNGQEEIYTSSFLGCFKRLVQRLGAMRGDQFLESLHYDHFRTFITMCAGYNTLSDFLNTMDENARTVLMSKFIDGLGKGKEDDLDDAVDVANAFGSIKDAALMAFLQKKVSEDYELSKAEKNEKGEKVYSILTKIIEGNNLRGNDLGALTQSLKLKIPPINRVAYNELTNEAGIVYQQIFFYGDKDGRDAYESFMETFKKDKNWNIENTHYWTRISSVKGKKVIIYANLPLQEPNDEVSLEKLSRFLDSMSIMPTIMIHRGHSYHLPTTLAKLGKQARIVILGSCGGYQNLAAVLDQAPEAHIISSKQTGVRAVNEPIIKLMNQSLQAGEDVNWIMMWEDLSKQFSKNQELSEKFSDYVPPHKNLGAIFIKAYRKMGE